MFVVLYGWMLFRAESFQHVATLHLAFSHWTLPIYFSNYLLSLFFFSLPILVMEVLQRRGNGPLTPLSWHPTLLGLLQGILIVCILIFWEREKVPFIYFQF
jgi:hypothetical protein